LEIWKFMEVREEGMEVQEETVTVMKLLFATFFRYVYLRTFTHI